jgi:hypothetical protein
LGHPVAFIKLFKLFGCSLSNLRRALFYSHILPIFTWIYPVYPLFSRKQQEDLSKFDYTCLRRTLFCLEWNENLFSYALNELSVEDRYALYWNR